MTVKSINPATREVMWSFKTLTKYEALDAVDKAHEMFGQWRHTSFEVRKDFMLRFARQLREHRQELAELITLEMGKRIAESLDEIELSAEIVDYYAHNAEEFLSNQKT